MKDNQKSQAERFYNAEPFSGQECDISNQDAEEARKHSVFGSWMLSIKYDSFNQPPAFADWKGIQVDLRKLSDEERLQYTDLISDHTNAGNQFDKELLEQYLDLKAVEYCYRDNSLTPWLIARAERKINGTEKV